MNTTHNNVGKGVLPTLRGDRCGWGPVVGPAGTGCAAGTGWDCGGTGWDRAGPGGTGWDRVGPHGLRWD
eukprot:6006369-Prymnesium_polylepis.1